MLRDVRIKVSQKCFSDVAPGRHAAPTFRCVLTGDVSALNQILSQTCWPGLIRTSVNSKIPIDSINQTLASFIYVGKFQID